MSSRSLHRRTWGSGSLTAVLLHGSTSSSRTWWQAGPWLAAQGWSVVAFDLPSHGDSPPAGQPLTPKVAADAVTAVLAGDSIDLLIGHSFGAAVALTVAAQHPGQVKRLVLEGTARPGQCRLGSRSRRRPGRLR